MNHSVKLYIRILLILVSVFILSGWSQPNEKSFTINQVDIRAYLQNNGDMYVEELYTYSFSGEFNGTVRTIGHDGYKQTEFFKAYQMTDGQTLEHITAQELKKAIPLHVESTDYSDITEYRIFTHSVNESKKILYRYRLNGVVQKHQDIAQFYWRFFDQQNPSDLNHLTIHVVLPKQTTAEPFSYYMEDSNHGKLSLENNRTIVYHNDLLPARSLSQLRILFSPEWVPAMPSDRLYMKNELMNTAYISANQYMIRERHLYLITVAAGFAAFLLLGVSVVCLFIRIAYWFRQKRMKNLLEQLSQIDLLDLSCYFNKRRIKREDIIAGLLSLYQKKIITVSQIPLQERFRSEPGNPSITLKFHRLVHNHNGLSADEIYLLDWLFIEEDGYTFTLDSISGPTMDENQIHHIQMYKEKLSQYQSKLQIWKQKVLESRKLPRIKNNDRRKYHLIIMMCVFTSLMVIWLVIAATMSLEPVLIIGILLFVMSLIMTLLYRSRIAALIYMGIITCMLWKAAAGESLLIWTLTILFMSVLLCSYILPIYWNRGANQTIRQWKSQLIQGEYKAVRHPEKLEMMLQISIILGIGELFVKSHGEALSASRSNHNYPLLAVGADAVSTINYTYQTLSRITDDFDEYNNDMSSSDDLYYSSSNYHSTYHSHRTYNSSSSDSGSSGDSSGSGGGGGAGAF
ncbi:DUF2207 domain-containing protein [Paenibacillus wulumuqiensis]|uniref:DUF2207 domain-containing protein n=1 Tax=Paenibacillus wulumuqiensis TaxID=1567107 RepID=UPI00061916D1|nr:DUF2207 domain-containing protein [Paenibacillus wulumuqiensis]